MLQNLPDKTKQFSLSFIELRIQYVFQSDETMGANPHLALSTQPNTLACRVVKQLISMALVDMADGALVTSIKSLL